MFTFSTPTQTELFKSTYLPDRSFYHLYSSKTITQPLRQKFISEMAPDEVLEPSPATAPILNMLSMEDYLAAYNNTIQTSPEKRQSIDRSRALSPSGGGFVATLHERLHALCIPPPEYEIEDDSKGNQRFRGRVFIDAVGLGEIELDGVYPSKKKVKEELAREALAALNQAEKEGLLNQAPTETTPYSPTKARTNSITEPRSISSLLPPSLNIPRPAPPPVPVPIALATSASTTNVTDLMHIIQKHGLPYALFTVIADPPSSSLFVGTTSLPGVVEEISTPPGKKFPSKKHAKEYLAGVCLEKVKEYVAQKQAREEESKKRKSDDPLSRTASSDSATVEGNNDTPTLPDNHYTGVLNCKSHPLFPIVSWRSNKTQVTLPITSMFSPRTTNTSSASNSLASSHSLPVIHAPPI